MYNEILVSLKKDGIPIICNNMGETREHFAKQKKSHIEKRQMSHDITYM